MAASPRCWTGRMLPRDCWRSMWPSPSWVAATALTTSCCFLGCPHCYKGTAQCGNCARKITLLPRLMEGAALAVAYFRFRKFNILNPNLREQCGDKYLEMTERIDTLESGSLDKQIAKAMEI